MKFNRRARLDSSQVSDQRGRRPAGRTAAAGGGIGVVIIALIALLTGNNPADLLGGDDGGASGVQAEPGSEGELERECQTVADIDQNADCRFVLYVNSAQAFWEDYFAAAGEQYTPATTTFFTSSVTTRCGTASSQVGPFYCPGDQNVYLDLGFFDQLRTTYGGPSGQFAEAYVLAHEYGHHIQNLTGQMQRVRTQSGPTSDAVRLELQADCYAGMWAHHATTAEDGSGQPLITELTQQDISDALSAANTVGDDYIQERFQGTVTPESWTHGSSEQRQRWFTTGLKTGDIAACDTFAASSL
ncbi:KPN_02809 family neutral zinc metallopeptidase [Jiangella mangrovi]|uniref:KPN_02809 family neutral zinc metallopeptidase n=1 Tax=Jiangella mangrovi TaxID=1524084 RepID=UPI0016071F94|nr:neutral zinc metallopeptidase [Jiangella mangrovi]